MCENFQVRTSKSPAKIHPTRITAWPEAAHMCWLYGSLQMLGIWIQLTLGGRVKQKVRKRIHIRLEFVGTEMPNLEVKGLNFLSRGKLVGDLALFILVNCHFLLKEPFPDTCVLFKFLYQIILPGLLETS